MRGPLSFPARVIMLMEANLRSLASHRSRQRLIAPICSTADMRQAVMKFRKTAYLDGVTRCVCVVACWMWVSLQKHSVTNYYHMVML